MNAHRPRALRGITTSALTPERDDWRQHAACRDYEPEAFFPVAQPGKGVAGARMVAAEVEYAKAVCARCPVRVECLTGALERDERYGIWGGMTTEERDALTRKDTTA